MNPISKKLTHGILLVLLTVLLAGICSFQAVYASEKPELAINAQDGSAYCVWTEVNGAEFYEVHKASYASGKWGAFKYVDETAYTHYYDDNVKIGKKYKYKIAAYDEECNLISESDVYIHTASMSAVTISHIMDAASGGPVLSWNASTYNNGKKKADSYRVFRSTKENGTYKRIAITTKTTYTDKKTVAGKTYYYKVKAICKANSAINSALSSPEKVKAVKKDKKLAAAMKKCVKSSNITIISTLDDILKDSKRYKGSDWWIPSNGVVVSYLSGNAKLSDVYDFSPIKKAGAKIVEEKMGKADPYWASASIQIKKNGADYGYVYFKSYGLAIHKVKKGSTDKAIKASIKEQVAKYYPTKNWKITVKKNTNKTEWLPSIYYSLLKEHGYGKYQNKVYQVTLVNKANKNKKASFFTTAIPK